ncbi:MAG: hypothetical protein M3R04_02710 [bacterium]|nr:hypothetical protein [bacterium]
MLSPPSLWHLTLRILLLLALGMTSCARDVNKGQDLEEPFPLQIDLLMDLAQDPTSSANDNWYYFVFNFGTLGPTEVTRPTDLIVGPDRGKNWEMYVAFHKDPTTGDEVVITDRRSRIPSTLPTLAGPVDATAGSFNPDLDQSTDILIADRDDNAIEMFFGETANFRDNVYFETAVVIDNGPQPLRIFASSPSIGGSFGAGVTVSGRPEIIDLDGDAKQDAVVIFGGGGAGAFIRPLLSNGDRTFDRGVETPVTGIPVDAIIADLDTAGTVGGTPDLAILTVDSPGGSGTVRIFTGETDGSFAVGPTLAVGTDPVQIAGGSIDPGSDLDLAVANAGDDDIDVFLGSAGVTFSADSTLAAGGQLRGVSINTMLGTGGDVVFSFDGVESGNVGVYMREAADTEFAATPITQDIERAAGRLVTFDSGADQRIDVFNLDPATAGTAGNVVIARSERVRAEGSTTPQFAWAETPIIYPAGNVPTRIVPVDLEGDGDLDLLVPNSGTQQNGKNLAVYINLGRYQFADFNIYWTDGNLTPPQDVFLQPWYLEHTFNANRITLKIDASQFYSLADIPPEELLRGQASRNYFIFDMMSTNAPIDFVNKDDEDLGTVTENFLQPVLVPLNIGHLNNNVTTSQVNTPVSPPERDITDWQVEAN